MTSQHDPAKGQSESEDEESRSERVNRELIELINELRVALLGVQVLFAFLLAVPFATGFEKVTDFQRDLYFSVLLSTVVASALMIAPSAYHRVNFRARDKERMLQTSNALMITGLGFIALSIVGALTFVADYLYAPAVSITCGVIGLSLFAGLWFVLPVVRRNPDETPDN